AAPAEVVPDVPPPAGLAAAETARSRRCVPVLNRLDSLDVELEPLARRAERIRQLDRAVLLEDTTRAAPWTAGDTLEAEVRAWFEADQALGREYAESGDSAIDARRGEARDRIRQRLMEALAEVSAEGRTRVEA